MLFCSTVLLKTFILLNYSWKLNGTSKYKTAGLKKFQKIEKMLAVTYLP